MLRINRRAPRQKGSTPLRELGARKLENEMTDKRRRQRNATAATAAPTAGAHVYQEVKTLLLDGAFNAANWIPVDELAAKLQVSRQPVMDAIKRLAFEGFLEIVPQVGSRVRKYEIADIEDFFELFAVGEAQVARLAAQRASEEDIINLHLVSAQIGALAQLKRRSADVGKLYRTLNRRLHDELRAAAHSVVLGEVVQLFHDRSDFFISSQQGSTFWERIEAANSEHEVIVSAIENRDPDAAYAAMRKHILAVGSSLKTDQK